MLDKMKQPFALRQQHDLNANSTGQLLRERHVSHA